MAKSIDLIEIIKSYGVGRRKLDDMIFSEAKPPPRLGNYDMDDENLCHEILKTTCNIPGCNFTSESLLDFEDHYNSTHRYACAQCKKVLPSPHLLDLHLQETHDSFFAVMAERKASYCCYIEECKVKFMNAEERHNHCVKVHKLPKDFRFEQTSKSRKKLNKSNTTAMNLDSEKLKKGTKVIFTNNKQKTFPKYTGRKFTTHESKTKTDSNMEITIVELKENLPQ